MGVQTANKNITIIHKCTHFSPPIVLWSKKRHVCKSIKSIPCCALISKSTRIFVENCFELFFACKFCLICAYFSPQWDKMTFSLEKAWIEDSFELKNILIMYLFLTSKQLFASQDISWWTGVLWVTCGLLWCFYQLFKFSCWRHPFTAEDPFVRDVMLHFSKTVPMKKKLIYLLGLRVNTLSENVWVNYSSNASYNLSWKARS